MGHLGSFEGWVELVAGAVRFAIGSDPLEARKSLQRGQADVQLQALRALLGAMISMGALASDGRSGTRLKARDIVARLRLGDPDCDLPPALAAARDALGELVSLEHPGAPTMANRLGQAMHPHLGRAVEVEGVGTVRLRGDTVSGTVKWSVERVSKTMRGRNAASAPQAGLADRGTYGTCGTFSSQAHRGSNDYQHDRGAARTGEKGPTAPTGPTIDPFWTLATDADATRLAEYLSAHPERIEQVARARGQRLLARYSSSAAATVSLTSRPLALQNRVSWVSRSVGR